METPERSAYLPSVRAYPWQRELVVRAAELERIKTSEYIRNVLVDASRRRIAKAERES